MDLFDAKTSRAIESRALAGFAPGTLMSRAGLSVARLALALAPGARRVWVAAGPGGNGGDGLHAAAELASRGVVVEVSWRAGAAPPAAVEAAARRARAAGAVVHAQFPSGRFDLCIDAMLGLGSNRPPDSGLGSWIEQLNRATCPVLAIDLPTGLSPDTGARLGPSCVKASATLALLTLKPGLFTGEGRELCGDLWFDDLGVSLDDGDPPTARTIAADEVTAASAPRRHAQHKGSFGDVLLVGGGPGMLGALRLAAGAAQGAGAGRTLVSPLDPQAPLQDSIHPEWIWMASAWAPAGADLENTTVVCGPGGGDIPATVLAPVISRSARLVLDADALNRVARDPSLAELLRRRAARALATVMTPHPLEASRLLDIPVAEVQGNRLAAAQALCERYGACTVLKGSGTIVAMTGRTPRVNVTGHAGLATGGTGDVLAGWLGGLWAQHAAGAQPERRGNTGDLPATGDPLSSALACACAAVWLHGQAVGATPGRAVAPSGLAAAMADLADAGKPLYA